MEEEFFNKIPDDIVLQIFQWLTFYQCVTLLPLVCKRWHALSRDSSLFHFVDLNCVKMDEDRCKKGLLKFFKVVSPRVVRWCPTRAGTASVDVIIDGEEIKAEILVLSHAVVADLCLDVPNLTHLNLLHSCPITLEAATAIAQLQHLRSLQFKVSSVELENILPIFFHRNGLGSRLEILQLHLWMKPALYTRADKWDSLKLLRVCESLRSFSIICSYAAPVPLHSITENFLNLQDLHLKISECSNGVLSSSWRTELHQTFQCSKNLRHVSLHGVHLRSNYYIKLLCNSCGSSLETLVITSDAPILPISDHFAQNIVCNCPQLIVLCIPYSVRCHSNQSIADLDLKSLTPQLFLVNFTHELEDPGDDVMDIVENLAIVNPQVEARVNRQSVRNDELDRAALRREFESRLTETNACTLRRILNACSL